MQSHGQIGPEGHRAFVLTGADGTVRHITQEQLAPANVDHLTMAGAIRNGMPQRGLPAEVNLWRRRNQRNLWRGLVRVQAARSLRVPHAYGAVHLRLVRAAIPDGPPAEVVDFGLASMRVVTDAGVAFMVDAFQNLVELEAMKFHGFGSGTTAEAASQTGLVTEFTTQYTPDNTRPTGSQTEAAANIYRSVGTMTAEGSITIAEHGLFSAASAGTMLDRSTFTGLPLVINDSLQVTYDLTIASGS